MTYEEIKEKIKASGLKKGFIAERMGQKLPSFSNMMSQIKARRVPTYEWKKNFLQAIKK